MGPYPGGRLATVNVACRSRANSRPSLRERIVSRSAHSTWHGRPTAAQVSISDNRSLRNAQSAAAVNLEVIRSRVASGAAADSLQSFADNAAQGLDDSARLAESMTALCSALTAGVAGGSVAVRDRTERGAALDLAMPQAAAERLLAAVSILGARIGLDAERSEAGVILRIPLDDKTDRR